MKVKKVFVFSCILLFNSLLFSLNSKYNFNFSELKNDFKAEFLDKNKDIVKTEFYIFKDQNVKDYVLLYKKNGKIAKNYIGNSQAVAEIGLQK